jgi:hypothetical protein
MRFTVYGGDPKVRIAVIDYCTGADSAEHDANARLISAAPDLLAALESAVEWIGQYDDPYMCEWTAEILAASRAAISKATGE